MGHFQMISSAALLLERPDLRKECSLRTEAKLQAYMLEYSVYNHLLLQFLIKRLYLDKFDNALTENNDLFHAVKDQDKDLYQSSAIGFLDYYYLRNNLYIERLCPQDRDMLRRRYEANTLTLDDAAEAFIARTFMQIIAEKPGRKNLFINYGPNNKKYFGPADAVIIGVRYDALSGLPEGEDPSNLFANSAFLLQMQNEFMGKRLKSTTDIPCHIMEFNEFSVRTLP